MRAPTCSCWTVWLRGAALAALLHLASIEAAAAQAPPPDEALVQILIKDAVIALNHANLTGNYTVLRDLGSPAFRSGNDAARLAAIFAPLRDQGLDLAPILVFAPRIAQAALTDEDTRLRLAGTFPTRPSNVNFELVFEPVGGRWRLLTIGVTTSPAPAEPTGDGAAATAADPVETARQRARDQIRSLKDQGAAGPPEQ